ncbi:hypothetical protein D3C71_609560 [compost metagenome]
MTRIYIVYIGVNSKAKTENIKNIMNVSIENSINMELAGMSWIVEIDTDKENFFKKDEFDKKYDFDGYLLEHVFVNDSIDKIISVIFTDQNLEYVSITNKKDLIEKELIEKFECLKAPFAVRYCSNEEFVYPSYLTITK